MSNVFIALGGNLGNGLGDVRSSFESACAMLGHTCHIVAVSKLYRTPALVDKGAAPQPDYLNAVVHLVTTLPPAKLLSELHRIEAAHGRERKEHWGSRTLDLDLIDYEGVISQKEALMLPHHELHKRLFVLQPLMDIQPNWIHPVTALSIQDMIQLLVDTGEHLFEGEAWQLQH